MANSVTTSKDDKEEEQYRCLVVDSGPIIKHTGISALFGKAQMYYTVPGVMDEIRDSKARAHLEQWPMELHVKTPSPESIHEIISFSKQTGDYVALSKVDLEVLALVLDLEKEGCLASHTMNHIRTSAKRVVGLGNIQSLKKEEEEEEEKKESNEEDTKEVKEAKEQEEIAASETETPDREVQQAQGDGESPEAQEESTPSPPTSAADAPIAPQPTPASTAPSKPKSWALLVNPTAASTALPQVDKDAATPSLARMSLAGDDGEDAGQFSDAEDDDGEVVPFATATAESPEDVEAELELAFPSLAAASTVPYEGSDEEGDEDDGEGEAHKQKPTNTAITDAEILEQKKAEALKPISKSGKMYNSFRKYGKQFKAKPANKKATVEPLQDEVVVEEPVEEEQRDEHLSSRIITGAAAGMVSGGDDMGWDEDDGEGWITCKSDIANSTMGGKKLNKDGDDDDEEGKDGPPKSARAACTTTDFTMQNVLLQMGLSLLSVDGIQIRRVKSWVYRCGACFKIHTDAEFQRGMKRQFCSHCGSDMMQRISASLDGKTGRLKLHLSKKYKHNLRGTKFSLPKPGSVSESWLFLKEKKKRRAACIF